MSARFLPLSNSVKPSSVEAPQFKWAFLMPQYWGIWFGALILYILICLPYPVIKKMGGGVAYLLKTFAKKRIAVAKQNIDLCYPEWSAERRQAVFEQNIYRTGMALFETAMGWWWPTWRVKRIGKIEGFEHVEAVLNSGKGVFGLALHNVNLELACRVIGIRHPSIAFYRKHNNPLMDYLQYHGRNRSNKYMIHKRNAKGLIKAMDQGELCLYLPDQDYGKAQSIFVPFGGVEQTATTTGTLMFASRANCVPLLISPQYSETGYLLKIYPPISYLADTKPEEALTQLNSDLLSCINEQPESYLWMHKRFKTRPESEPESLYK